jgi:DHA2 family multidrug resistance protein
MIGVFSGTAGFVVESTLQGALMLSDDDNRWISISFIMMLGVVLPLAAYLADRYGYKRLFFVGTVILCFGSLLNCFSFDFWSLLISRAITGVGAGTLFPISIAIIDQVFPKDKLVKALSLYVGLGFGVGTFLGILTGGFSAQYLSWKTPFLICFFLGIPSLFATWVLHPESTAFKSKKFDYLGYVLFTIFISALLVLLVSAKAEWNAAGWNSPFILWCIVFAIVSLIWLVWVEIKTPNPIILFSLFRIKSFSLGCFAIFVVGLPLYATQLLTINFLDADLGYAKYTIGLYLCSLGVTLGVFSAVAAFLTKKIDVRILTMIGLSLITLSCWLNPDMTIYSSHFQIFGINNLRVLGVSLTLGPATSLAMSEIQKEESGIASVFVTLARQIGGTLGTLIAGLMMIDRFQFHNQIFGSRINQKSAAFEKVSHHLQTHLIHNAGASPLDAADKAEGIIRANVMTQANATAMTDFFYLLGFVTFAIVIGLLVEFLYEKKLKTQKN